LSSSEEWSRHNQNYLVACIDILKSFLDKRSNQTEIVGMNTKNVEWPIWNTEPQPAINTLYTLFGLSEFEKILLLLCAAVELDSEISNLCAINHQNQKVPYPTFGLALAIFPNPHWNALAPTSPLRTFSLIKILDSPSSPLISSALKIEERVLFYLTGISYIEPELDSFLKPIYSNTTLVDSHKQLLHRVLTLLHNNKRKIIQLSGSDEESKKSLAKEICFSMGLDLWEISWELEPLRNNEEMARFIQVWTREALLLGSGLYIGTEGIEPIKQKHIIQIMEKIPGPIFIGVNHNWNFDLHSIFIKVNKPNRTEQNQLWKAHLGSLLNDVNDQKISKITSQFDLNVHSILAACEEASLLSEHEVDTYKAIWEACRIISRPKLSDLAQCIISTANINDLVLPEKEKRILCEIGIHVSNRQKVYEEWGFKEKSSRGLGITILFTGASGTGKTIAAEVLANELHLDLFRIDISNVISKYIGETEKNLRKVFDAADESGAILFFDEASKKEYFFI